MATDSAPTAETRAIETKLAAARARLILDKPFLGALVLRLPMKAARSDWCPTTATDVRAFYYNPVYIAGLSLEQTQFMLAHEALHCALSHFARRQHRTRHRWDLACDYAINPLLVTDGLQPPPGALLDANYRGMTAEEIYPLIDPQDPSETLDTHAYHPDPSSEPSRPPQATSQPSPRPSPTEDHGKNDVGTEACQPAPPPPPLGADEQETLSIQWQQRLAGAAQQARQAGKLGGELERLVEHLLQPRLPWRVLLAHYMTATARDDYTYFRPSRREGSYILPSLRSHQLEVTVAIDTSGSISAQELDEFCAEVDLLKGQIRARITLLPCDARLAEGAPWRFEPWEAFRSPQTLKGGGGTSFIPVFQWIDQADQQPNLLVYFTDAEGVFPPQPPPYPVIWLVKGRSPVPWGQRIQLN